MKRIMAVIGWVCSPQGRTDIGAAIAAVTALYTGLHRAGVL